MSQTTKRYLANRECTYNCYDFQKNDLYQFGCEFEFYIDTKKYNLLEAIDQIKDELFVFSNVDILVDTTTLPNVEDKNQCIQIKPDQSLEDNGIEISTPITSQNGVKHYIENILPLIEKYGYTNEDTGLHFHISTTKSRGVNFNFYLYMLLCNDKKLLSSWLTRSGYSHNVMDILSQNSKAITRKIKNKKGRIWNLEKVSSSHIEIKSVGGVDYHKEMTKIIAEFEIYAASFDSVLNDSNSEYMKSLIDEHKKLIASLDQTTQKEFSKAVIEAGLID
jgi:hypothetical protein